MQRNPSSLEDQIVTVLMVQEMLKNMAVKAQGRGDPARFIKCCDLNGKLREVVESLTRLKALETSLLEIAKGAQESNRGAR